MGWTIISVLYLLSCNGEQPQDKGSPSESGTVEETGTPTGQTGVTGQTADTATTETWSWGHEPCDGQPRTDAVTLYGVDVLDWAGFSVDVEDMEGDGCDEVLVGLKNAGYNTNTEGAVHLLRAPQSGRIDMQSYVTWEEPDADNWMDRSALVPPQAVWFSGLYPEESSLALAFDIPSTAPGVPVGLAQLTGRLLADSRYYGFLNDIEGCEGIGTPSLCFTSVNITTGIIGDESGAVWIVDAPIIGDVDALDFRVRIHGNPGDRAEPVEADDDLDGDGLHDLLIGAFNANGAGRLALVADPPPGDHVVWDIAFATIEGETVNGQLGLGLATGDIDGDGYVDVLGGAPISGSGNAYLLMGPFSGTRPVASALATIAGDIVSQWTGYDGAIGDMDGDGAAELVVSASFPLSGSLYAGSVAVFHEPVGSYFVSEAPLLLTSGSKTGDGFGFALAPGDIDGDGLMDLAIGAPTDSRGAPAAGSVTIVFGASL